MSEVVNQSTAILLPEAEVAVYTHDPQVLEAYKALGSDWRFARVDLKAAEGDVELAISTYTQYASPDVIIVQTDTIDSSFTERLAALAQNCDEGTSAIVIGPENDVNLYRSLIDMGVSDYLVRPVETPVLAEVIAKTLVEKKGVSGSTLIAVNGAKGGVGASLLSEGLACGVADILKKKTVLMDAAGGWSSLGVGLGYEPSTTLTEAVKAAESEKPDNLKRMMHDVSENLQVLATGGDVMLEQGVGADELEVLINMLLAKSPVVIVDLSHAPEALQKVVLARANLILLVSTPTLPALRLARTLISEVKDIRGGGEDDALKLVVNMQGVSPAHEVSKNDISDAVGISVSGFFPFLPKVFLGCESSGKKLTDDKEALALIEANLLKLVKPFISSSSNTVEAGTEKSSGFMSGLLGKISKGS